MKPMFRRSLVLLASLIGVVPPTLTQSAPVTMARSGALGPKLASIEATLARSAGNTRRYTLVRRSTGEMGARGQYSGDGASMKVLEVGDARSGTMRLIAVLTAAGKSARFEAFCGAGQCEEFDQKSGPKARVRFYPGKAVVELEDD